MHSKTTGSGFDPRTGEAPIDVPRLFNDAIEVAIAEQDRQGFFTWFKTFLPRYIRDPQIAATPEACNALSAALGRIVWNAIPLPRLGFRPDTVAEPGRNDACLCGSGRKYKHCCRNTLPLPPIEEDTIWPQLLLKLSPGQRSQAFATHRVPLPAVALFAEQRILEGQAAEAIALLEACIDAAFAAADAKAATLVGALCNAYDAVDAGDEKLQFLRRTTELPKASPLRAEAWVRLATIEMGDGRSDAAWAAFRQARHDGPDIESLSSLEIIMLLGDGRYEDARRCARVEIKRLQRRGADPDDPLFEFLQDVVEDPESALRSPHGSDDFMEQQEGQDSPLRDWLDGVAANSLPEYAIVLDDAARPPERPPESPLVAPRPARLVAPQALQRTEAAWRKVFKLGKPISTQDTPPSDDDVWSQAHFDRWRQFLDDHAGAFDSLDILDDLTTALLLRPYEFISEFDSELRILLQRSRNILMAALNRAPQQVQLCWISPVNRPALRSLHRLQAFYENEGDEELALETANLMLALNPHDNHGVRCWLVNEYLMGDDNKRALAVSEPYAKDYFPETRFGRVLALHRLGRHDEALTALAAAHSDLPQVVRYLTAEAIEPPELHAFGVRPAGEDQAWLYREDMRHAWSGTPGAMQTLQSFAASHHAHS